MSHPTFAGVNFSPAQLLMAKLLMGNRFHYIRAGDIHLADALNHEDEVGYCRAVDGAAGTGTNDHRKLWNDTRAQCIMKQHITNASEA